MEKLKDYQLTILGLIHCAASDKLYMRTGKPNGVDLEVFIDTIKPNPQRFHIRLPITVNYSYKGETHVCQISASAWMNGITPSVTEAHGLRIHEVYGDKIRSIVDVDKLFEI